MTPIPPFGLQAEHCWHFANEAGMGNTHRQTCCWCGWHRDAIRHEARNPAHGPHQPYQDMLTTWTYGEPRPTTSQEWRGVPGFHGMVEKVTVPDPGCSREGMAFTVEPPIGETLDDGPDR